MKNIVTLNGNIIKRIIKVGEGRTGFPIVDAAMTELNQTGFMHNRMRMVVSQFLTKDLFIDWTWGEDYFRTKLIDFDSASNVHGW